MSGRFLVAAAVALVLGLGLGLFMAIGHDHTLMSVHAHVALTGWASMALFALAYRAWPQLSTGRLAPAHFWLYSVGFWLSMLGLALLEKAPSPVAEPLAGGGAVMLTLGAVCFAARVVTAKLDG